jgi:hypothetical protein
MKVFQKTNLSLYFVTALNKISPLHKSIFNIKFFAENCLQLFQEKWQKRNFVLK